MHTWGKSEGPGGIRLSFILSITGLVLPIGLILLALRPPAQGVPPHLVSAASAQSFQSKRTHLEEATAQSTPPQEVRLSADEISAAFALANGLPVSSAPMITLHDDLVTGQFITRFAGQRIYVAVSGHVGAKDGYIIFAPTDFKVGDLNIPIALVNPVLQRKLREQREQLKLPAFVYDLRVQNGELVIRPK